MPYGIDFIAEVFAANRSGNGLSAEQVSELASRLDRMMRGKTFEDAFDVAPGWRSNVRRDLQNVAYSEVERSAAEWRSELLRYHAHHYDEDLMARVKPTGRRGRLFAAIVAAGGRVPSLRSVQRFMGRARQPADGFGAAADANRSSEKNDRS